jgi:hypothetical protein
MFMAGILNDGTVRFGSVINERGGADDWQRSKTKAGGFVGCKYAKVSGKLVGHQGNDGAEEIERLHERIERIERMWEEVLLDHC